MTTKQSIDDFMAQKNIAVAGVSRKKQKFGNAIYKELAKRGYTLFPVNPNLEEYDGGKCYPDIEALPAEVSAMVINTKPEVTKKLLDKAIQKGIKHIWLQQGAADKETIAVSEQSDANVISKQCVIMFADPAKGIHGFHKWINKTFGMLPK